MAVNKNKKKTTRIKANRKKFKIKYEHSFFRLNLKHGISFWNMDNSAKRLKEHLSRIRCLKHGMLLF